jgi:hypothetical protein
MLQKGHRYKSTALGKMADEASENYDLKLQKPSGPSI